MNTIRNIIFILAILGILIFSVIDLIGIHKCTNCQETIIGKAEKIHDKMVCDRCFSHIYLEENK